MRQKKLDLTPYIRAIPNWPKKGIMFRDITTLLKDKHAFQESVTRFVEHYKNLKIDKVVGIESRGFILGSAVAYALGVGFVPVRKFGKLPGETIKVSYDLEYGKDQVEMHKDAILPGEKVLIIDDLIATGGTALAACKLVEQLQGKIMGLGFLVDLPDLHGKDKLNHYPIFTLMEFTGL